MNTDNVHDWVQDYYGKVLAKSEDLKTNACCATGAPPARILDLLQHVHTDVLDRFYGCGFPVPEALEGATVVDLGCGTGRDVYLISQLVGERGMVHGIDMTTEQLDIANSTLAWHTERFGFKKPNVAFHQGYIEDLSQIADASVDVVVSNCVVNLSPRKDIVMKEIVRILKPGGEFYFSDVFADRRLPDEIAFDPILHSECLGGAMYRPDFISLAKQVGFPDPRVINEAPITIQNAEIEKKVGAARFESVTLRLLKLADVDELCEDYGQIAVYKGTMPIGKLFKLDDHHVFEAGRPERVCGNTAAMLQQTRFAEHFTIIGDTSVHYGAYPCDPTMAATIYLDEDGGGASCC
ncbi:MAG: arsenite methyltransferase [Bradymonadia bacterium]|jgi:arsenite methyltransferase